MEGEKEMSKMIQAKVTSVEYHGSIILVFCTSEQGKPFSIPFDSRQFFHMIEDKWTEDENFVFVGQTIEYQETEDGPVINFVD